LSNRIKSLFLRVSDSLFRKRNKIIRQYFKLPLFSDSAVKSDSQVTFYEKAVDDILQDESKFNKFRRIYNYREILEHVDFKQGEMYLERTIKLGGRDCLNNFPSSLKENVGRPWVFTYPVLGNVSPTSLRYFAVTQELRARFGDPKSAAIAEIGAGYGGQCLSIQQTWSVRKYFIYDLPNVQKLIIKYIEQIQPSDSIVMKQLDDDPTDDVLDLVISNYAFSELPLEVQKKYLEKVILKSKRGYMIMNSGRTNQSGRSAGKMTLTELQDLISDIQIHDEQPLTGADNYVITWGPRFEE